MTRSAFERIPTQHMEKKKSESPRANDAPADRTQTTETSTRTKDAKAISHHKDRSQEVQGASN